MYFEELHNLHEKWLVNKDLLPAPVLVIDANVDLHENPDLYSKHEEGIMECLKKRKNNLKTTNKMGASPLKEVNRQLSHLMV